MSKIDALFWISMVLTVASFGLFGFQIWHQARRAVPRRESGIGGAQPQALDVGESLKAVGEMAESFAKAGPIATTGTLCALFLIVALITSGVVKIGA
jgi:hypothetical protein